MHFFIQEEFTMLKKIIAFLLITVPIIFLLAGCHMRADIEDIETAEMRIADEVGKISSAVRLGQRTENPDKKTEELEFLLTNKSQEGCSYSEELVIDKKIDGTWYFWGKVSSDYESGEFALGQGGEALLKFPLCRAAMSDADNIENYRGEVLFVDGTEAFGDSETRIILSEGDYRARVKVRLEEASAEEAVCEFEAGK